MRRPDVSPVDGRPAPVARNESKLFWEAAANSRGTWFVGHAAKSGRHAINTVASLNRFRHRRGRAGNTIEDVGIIRQTAESSILPSGDDLCNSGISAVDC